MTELALTQRPDHVARIGDSVVIDGDPYTVREIKPQRERGVFLDWNQVVQYSEVIVTVERFDTTNPPRIFTEGGSAESSEDAAYTARSDADRRKAETTTQTLAGRSGVARA